MISLPDEPGAYTFTDGLTFGNLNFGSDGKDDKEGRSTPNPTLLEIRAAIEELDQTMQATMETIREDQVGIMDHLWVSILRLSSSARSVKARMQSIEDVVGDAEAVLDKYTLGDLSEGLLMALGRLDATEIPDIQNKVVTLADLIKVVNEDHKRAARFLLGKVNSLVPPTTHGSRTGPIGHHCR
jgi:hypothetical protein